MSAMMVFKYTGSVALGILAILYLQASFYGDLWSNPNWTISNVMVYDYNKQLTHYLLFPCYIVLCVVYFFKHTNIVRIRLGSVVAIVGGIGLILHPVTTHKTGHLACAGLVFSSSYFWYPECTPVQLQTFCLSSIFFLGGFVLDIIMATITVTAKTASVVASVSASASASASIGDITVENDTAVLSFSSFVPSFLCMLGEFGIFITWGIMIQNPLSACKKND